MRTKLFQLPPYSPTLYVVVGREVTGEILSAHIRKKFGVKIPNLKTEANNCYGSCNAKGSLIVMYLRTLKGVEAEAVLAHECLHAVAETMRYSGVQFSDSSEEAWTYLLGYMVENILKWRDRA